MKNKEKSRMRLGLKILFLIIALFFLIDYFFVDASILRAYTVVKKEDFRITAKNRWSSKEKKNYANVDWDEGGNLTQSGYRLYQSEDGGVTWNTRSLKYGKSIKVLNIYPDYDDSNTLKMWMDSLKLTAKDGSNLIQVDSVTITNYNKNPDAYLKNSTGIYQYDVLMFGSWDHNAGKDLTLKSRDATQEYIDTGRGVLFGHDATNHPVFATFNDQLGITDVEQSGAPSEIRLGGEFIEIKNDGYLMKYPFEFSNGQILEIPATHNNILASKHVGTNWVMFKPPYTIFNSTLWENENWTMGWYLNTNNNVGMIQTGHSNGASTLDERKLIANTLYNLAQVSLDSYAEDQTVKDDKAPDLPGLTIRCGSEGNDVNLRVNAIDNGKDYQWYVDSDSKEEGLKKSDIVEETIISNIAGYFYEITDSPTTNLFQQVETYKDSFGRIDPEKYDVYVAPGDDSLEYETRGSFEINVNRDSEKFIHILAVDRANNVSQVMSQQIKDVPQEVDFSIERTKDEAKLVDLSLRESLENNIEKIEIRLPKNTAIKELKLLELPKNWAYSEDKKASNYDSIVFSIDKKNDLQTITKFLNDLRFSINEPTDAEGEIQLLFYEDRSSDKKVTEVCWTSAIPQIVALKGYDDKGNRLPSTDLVIDQKIRINKKESIIPKTSSMYDFIELTDLNGKQIDPLEYKISASVQEGRLVYAYRKLTVHVRQVIVNKNSSTVIPTHGFGKLESSTNEGQKRDLFSLQSISTEAESTPFDTYLIRYKASESVYTFTSQVPMNYSLIGYVLTKDEVPHLQNNSSITLNSFDALIDSEVWITTYLTPITEEPTFYHGDSKENKLGTINIE
ncbi:hypothetical protein ACYSNW_14955 [Enterococcus sp. LJL99]